MPLISDLRFAPDTLFLVAEEDWRLWRDDCKQGTGLQPTDLPEDRQAELSAPSADAECWKAPSKLSADATRTSGLELRRQREQPSGGAVRGWGRAKKAKAAEVQETSQELCDILNMVNSAHRCARGDLVWLSYTVSKKTQWTPTHGSTLLAVSARGGRLLHSNWSEWFKDGPNHFDLCLKHVLQELSASAMLPSSYVYPSLGGFDDHISAFQNTKVEEVRQCYWEHYNARQEGTREHDHNGRAFSRLMPWQKYQLKEFPREQTLGFEVILLDEIPTRPLDSPDIWWTAATTISPQFYNEPEPARQAKDVRKIKDSAELSAAKAQRQSDSAEAHSMGGWQLCCTFGVCRLGC